GKWLTRSPAPAPASSAPAGEKSATLVVNDKSIAVLPFANTSENKEANAFFADGVHDDILTNLAHISELRVISGTSVRRYAGTTKPMPEIARELGVAYVLTGSVQRAGSRVHVTGQLINARTDEHLWAQNYDRELTDVFAVQAELATAIASSLRTALLPAEK